MVKNENKIYEKEGWYIQLLDNQKFIYDLIYKYHNYFSKKDTKYRRIVRAFKFVILSLSMISTIVLGLSTIICKDIQVVVGLIVSALITFITSITTYFNFEEYWMRNITVHIELNLLRDNFIYDAKSNSLGDERIRMYRERLDSIQNKNLSYWNRSIEKLK